MPEPLFEVEYRKSAANSALEFSSNWMIGTILSKLHAQAAWEDSVENKVNQGRENSQRQSLEPRVLTDNSRRATGPKSACQHGCTDESARSNATVTGGIA